MNFTITNGDKLIQKEEQFINLYNQKTPVQTILNELNITYSNYQTLRKRLSNENRLIIRKKRPRRTRKKIQYNRLSIISGDKYYNSYQIKYEGKYVGTIKNRRNAEKIVELIKTHDYDINRFNEFKKQIQQGEV